jgi:DNA replication protein DnaC
MSQPTPLNQPIADLLRKTIEQAPGSGWCPLHQCPVKDIALDVGGRSINVHDRCPQCWEIALAEQKAQDAKAKLTRMRDAWPRMGIPPRYRNLRVNDFHASSPSQHAVLASAQRFCGLDIDWSLADAETLANQKEQLDSLLLLGNVGTGKTLLACGMLTDETYDRDGTYMEDGLYCTVAQLMRRIKMTWKKESAETEQDVFSKLAKLGLLVIDEIGVQFNSDTERCLLTELINDRYNAQQRTILVSNLTLKEFTQVVGERIVDRFREGGKVLVFDWASERGKNNGVTGG